MSDGDRLGVVEQLTWMVSQVASMNFLFVLELAAPFDEDRCRAALRALQRRHPRLAVRIAPSPPRFVRDGVPEIPCRIVDESGPGGWVSAAELEVDGPFDTLRGPLVRVTVVRRRAGFAVLLTFHHSAGDAASGALLAAHFATVYFGGELGPPPSGSIRPVEERLLPRPLHRRLWATISTLRTGWRVSRSRHLRLPEHAPSRPGERHQRLHPRTLDPAAAGRLLERCRAHGVRLTSIIAAALVIAVSREAASDGPRTVTCVVPVNLRPQMDADAQGEVGMFVSFVIGSVACEGTSDPWQVAAALHRQIHGAQERQEPLALLGLQGLVVSRATSPEQLYASTSKDAEQSTGLTNLGAVTHPALVDDPRVTGVGFTAANHPTGTLFGAAVVGFRGGVQLNFSHAEPCVAADRGAAIADVVMGLLTA